MCISYYQKQPGCDCTYATGTVDVCSLFESLPENKNRTSFRPKLVTSNCRELNLLFNGIDYVSVDVGEVKDVVPNGLECEDVRRCEEIQEPPGRCPLCDEPEVLRFLKARGVQFLGVAGEAAHGPQKKEAEAVAEGLGWNAAGMSV